MGSGEGREVEAAIHDHLQDLVLLFHALIFRGIVWKMVGWWCCQHEGEGWQNDGGHAQPARYEWYVLPNSSWNLAMLSDSECVSLVAC